MEMKRLYHGTYGCIKKPDLQHSRLNIDFGPGFYLTEDEKMAAKWACNKKQSFVNYYDVDMSDLKVCDLGLTKEWLHFIIECRGDYEVQLDYKSYDVIKGPVADDKMFRTISDYEDGYITAQEAIQLLNAGGFSTQYCFRTDKAINKLKFCKVREIKEQEKQRTLEETKQDRQKMEILVKKFKEDRKPKFRR